MIIRNTSDIAALIMDVRTKRGLTQSKLAKRIGVSRWWLTMIENGKPTTRLDFVLRTLNELGITLHAHGPDQTMEQVDAPKITIDIDDIADMGLENIKPKRTGPEK